MGLEIALIVVGCLIGIVGSISLGVSLWLSIQYIKFNKIENSANLTGEEVARKILDKNDLKHIKVKVTGSLMFGNSYSHYFKKVRLRRFTRHKQSLTSLGLGAQKASLAILDKEGDQDMKKRIRLYPIITFGPFAFIPLITVGFLLDYFVFNQSGAFVYLFGVLGLLFYVYAVVLSVLTLKTEKKAQEKAYQILAQEKLANEEELSDLKDLFRLYNIQYVNDIILSSLELIYTILEIAIAIKKAKYRNLTLKHKYTLFCVRHGFYAGLKFYAKLRLLIKR
jgi:Zn-dependent membrane protease YugP